MSWFSALVEDLRVDGCTKLTLLPRLLLAPRTQALALVRLAQASPRVLGPLFRRINFTLNACDISPHARIGPGLRLPHPLGIVIGPDVVIGAHCVISQNSTLGMGATGAPALDDEVVIGANAVVFGGITIGRQARIGANSVLWRDVPAGVIAAGAPARVVGRWSGAGASQESPAADQDVWGAGAESSSPLPP